LLSNKHFLFLVLEVVLSFSCILIATGYPAGIEHLIIGLSQRSGSPLLPARNEHRTLTSEYMEDKKR